MWKYREGNTKFSSWHEISAPRRPRAEEPEVSVLETLNTSSLQFLSVRRCLKSE